jgi:hypothetical protein
MKIEKEPQIDFADLLEKDIAGYNITWHMYNRYLEKAKPKTFSTISTVAKADSYMRASGFQKMSPKVKIALIIGLVICVCIIIIFVINNFIGGFNLGI